MQITKHTTNKTIIDDLEEDPVRRLPGSRLEDFFEVFQKTSWKSSSALYFKRLPRRLHICPPKSDPDLKNMYIKPRSEKHVYHIKKHSNGLKTEKMSGKVDRYTFIEHTKYISKWKMRTI